MASASDAVESRNRRHPLTGKRRFSAAAATELIGGIVALVVEVEAIASVHRSYPALPISAHDVAVGAAGDREGALDVRLRSEVRLALKGVLDQFRAVRCHDRPSTSTRTA
jgi:hypothetical protein